MDIISDSHDQCTHEQLEVASELSRVTQRCEKLLSYFIAPFGHGLSLKFIHSSTKNTAFRVLLLDN